MINYLKKHFDDILLLSLLLFCLILVIVNIQYNIEYNLQPEPYVSTNLVEPNSVDIYWLAKNIYFESRSESILAQTAVAHVTINRVLDARFPNTFQGVITQQYQFSWYWDDISDIPTDNISWDKSIKLATNIMTEYENGLYGDITNGSTFYYADYITCPKFCKSRNYVLEMHIGVHKFYSIRGISL